jgi:hypothetical protein
MNSLRSRVISLVRAVGRQDWKRAEAAYREGLQHEPSSVQLQQGLEEVLKHL